LQRDAAATSEAAGYFEKALEIARRQQARSLELRAALSLGRLWHRQGQAAQARELVAGVYGWFTEGLGTHDLLQAREFLDDRAPEGKRI
jgi:adenylate cyclase